MGDYMDEIDEEDLNAFLEATKIIANNTKPVAGEHEKTVKDEKEAEEIATVKINKEEIKHEAEKEKENDTKEEEEDESEEEEEEHESEEEEEDHESEEDMDEHESKKEKKRVNIASILSQYNQLNTVEPQVTEKIKTKESKKTSFDVTSILAKHGQLNMVKIRKVVSKEETTTKEEIKEHKTDENKSTTSEPWEKDHSSEKEERVEIKKEQLPSLQLPEKQNNQSLKEEEELSLEEEEPILKKDEPVLKEEEPSVEETPMEEEQDMKLKEEKILEDLMDPQEDRYGS